MKELERLLKESKSILVCRLLNSYANNIGPKGSREIAQAIKVNSSLQKIFLGENKIGDEGAREIAHAIKVNSTLQMIDLYRNNFGDGGAQELLKLSKTILLWRALSFWRTTLDLIF